MCNTYVFTHRINVFNKFSICTKDVFNAKQSNMKTVCRNHWWAATSSLVPRHHLMLIYKSSDYWSRHRRLFLLEAFKQSERGFCFKGALFLVIRLDGSFSSEIVSILVYRKEGWCLGQMKTSISKPVTAVILAAAWFKLLFAETEWKKTIFQREL